MKIFLMSLLLALAGCGSTAPNKSLPMRCVEALKFSSGNPFLLIFESVYSKKSSVACGELVSKSGYGTVRVTLTTDKPDYVVLNSLKILVKDNDLLLQEMTLFSQGEGTSDAKAGHMINTYSASGTEGEMSLPWHGRDVSFEADYTSSAPVGNVYPTNVSVTLDLLK